MLEDRLADAQSTDYWNLPRKVASWKATVLYWARKSLGEGSRLGEGKGEEGPTEEVFVKPKLLDLGFAVSGRWRTGGLRSQKSLRWSPGFARVMGDMTAGVPTKMENDRKDRFA